MGGSPEMFGLAATTAPPESITWTTELSSPVLATSAGSCPLCATATTSCALARPDASRLPMRDRRTRRTRRSPVTSSAPATTPVAIIVARVRMPVRAIQRSAGSRNIVDRPVDEAVTGPAHGLEAVDVERIIEFATEVADVDVDHIRV